MTTGSRTQKFIFWTIFEIILVMTVGWRIQQIMLLWSIIEINLMTSWSRTHKVILWSIFKIMLIMTTRWRFHQIMLWNKIQIILNTAISEIHPKKIAKHHEKYYEYTEIKNSWNCDMKHASNYLTVIGRECCIWWSNSHWHFHESWVKTYSNNCCLKFRVSPWGTST